MLNAHKDAVMILVPDFVDITDKTKAQAEEYEKKLQNFFSNNPDAADKIHMIYFGVRSKGIDLETMKDDYEIYFEVYFNEPFYYGKHGHKMKMDITFKLKREKDMFRTFMSYPNVVKH